ncbi:acyl-CoA synthetase [Amaricoccus sp.]|uniref:acyl-CoA synthetase n=1 Tax=Amaricoccus sp. TaxID=1872485 RepID=UPI0039E5AA5B
MDDGPPAPCPRPFNMAAHTFAAAARRPNHVALEVLAGPGAVAECWTHAELADAVRRTAGGLRARGIGRGDRVLLRLGNTADFPIVFFAANALGAVPVPVSAMLTAAELGPLVADLAPALIARGAGLTLPDPPGAPVIEAGDIAALRRADPVDFAETDPDDPAYMVYTSGTAGRPKGVVLAQRAAWARRMMWDGWYGLGPDDRVLHAGAFNWTYTLGAGLTDPWAAGATALIYAGPADRHVWPRLADAHRATIFAGAPGVYRQMLNAPGLAEGFSHLRHGLGAGEALAPSVRAAWTGATGRPIHEALGMSEISTYISACPARPAPAGCAGYPQPGRRVAILPDAGTAPVPRGTEGLLAVSRRDPGLMLGYWRRAEETAAAFRGEWFLTGDRAVMAEDGAIRHLGRADDLINAGGFRVSPQEVEAALAEHPGVAEAAVIELPVRDGVSIVAAFYVPRGAAIPEAELRPPLRRPARALQVPAQLPPGRRPAAQRKRQAAAPAPRHRRLTRASANTRSPRPCLRPSSCRKYSRGWLAAGQDGAESPLATPTTRDDGRP